MRERFARHRKTFTTAKKKSQQAGFGVTVKDREKGIYTIGHKLEKMFTCYDRMDALFSSRPNVTPLAEFSSSVPVAQEQDYSQQLTTGSRRPHRLPEDEDEDEDEDDDESQDPVEDAGGEPIGNYTQDIINNPDTFDNTFDNSYNDINDNLDNFDAETTNLKEGRDTLNGILEGDDISMLSISSTQVKQRQRKRALTDTESQASNKRMRITNRRKKRPTLDPPSSPEVLRRSFLSSFEQATTKKANETRRLELKENKLEWKKSLEMRKLELKEQQELRRLELEEQKMEQESQRWKSEMETRVTIQTLQVIQAGLEKGVSSDFFQSFSEIGRSAIRLYCIIACHLCLVIGIILKEIGAAASFPAVNHNVTSGSQCSARSEAESRILQHIKVLDEAIVQQNANYWKLTVRLHPI
ncbi:hypothetical protein BGZ90_009921 [Linnemannia elongata]|nr:hypothetical protein BGZ90_009921 [Linnemannia elongata]